MSSQISLFRLPTPIKINLNGEINDIRTQNDLPTICDLCEEADDHVELLLEHFKDNHYLKEGNYVCPFCDYTSPKHEVSLCNFLIWTYMFWSEIR